MSRVPAPAEMDGGSHSDLEWADRPFHAVNLSVGGSLQLDNLKNMAGSNRMNVNDV